MLRPVIDYGVSAITELAGKRSPAGIKGLTRADWTATLAEFTAGDQFFLPAFLFLVYGSYYQHERVVTALGLEPRAPHPKGYDMAGDDWSLLDPVREARKRFRATP